MILSQSILNLIGSYAPQLLPFILTTLVSIVAYYVRPRVKLIYGRANNSFHQLPARDDPAEEPKKAPRVIDVYCEKLYVQNSGRKPAEKVEVVLACSPSELSVFPARSFERKGGEEGELILHFPYIAPRELIILDTIHVNNRTAEILAVRCPETVGKRVEFWVQRRFSTAWNLFLGFIVFLGLVYVTQIILAFGSILVRAS